MTPRNRPSRPHPRPPNLRGGWSGGPIPDDRSWFPLVAFLVGLVAVCLSVYLTLP